MSAFFVGSSMILFSIVLLYIIMFHYKKKNEKELDFQYFVLLFDTVALICVGLFLIYLESQNTPKEIIWVHYLKSLKKGGLFFVFIGLIFLYYRARVIDNLRARGFDFEKKSNYIYIIYGIILIVFGLTVFIVL